MGKFKQIFCSRFTDLFPDFWYNCFLGVIEIFVFPVLMAAGKYEFIGAWIGFKCVAQWSAWNKNRYVFNRFLIVHAVMLIVCFLITQWGWLNLFTIEY